MKVRSLAGLMVLFTAVAFSYGTASAQVVDAVKGAASKTKDVTVDAAKKTAEVTKKTTVVVTDGLETAADKTKDVTVDSAKKTGSAAKKIGNYSVETTENVAGSAYEGGKWFMVTTWDGTKWVSKRTWYATKKAAGATKDAVVGNEEKKP